MLFDDIGRGGMAEIYLARLVTEAGAARHVVVKQILPELAEHSEFAEMLVNEAKLAARLSHKNVVQVTDLGREGDKLFIAMEYVEGFDLATLLRRCSQDKVPLPPEFALLIVGEALAGLDYAHRAKSDEGRPLGVVHRDVSPSNVLVSFEGQIKVCDFGIARATEITGADSDQSIKGKAGYMSPEHARGEPSLDARADVFAAGIVLWELFAGRKLYSSKAGSLIEQARAAEIPSLPARDLPEWSALAAIINKALAPNRDDRYASAGAMARDLDDYVRTAKLHASSLRLGEWLTNRFGAEIFDRRRQRERAAQAMMLGPAVVMVPIAKPVASAEPVEPQEASPASLVATSVNVPEPAASAPAVVRDSTPAPSPPNANLGMWVVIACALSAAIVWFLLHGR
jgi:serine/threonine-protein kinase